MKRECIFLLIALFFGQLVACERSKIDNVLPDGPQLRSAGDTAVQQPRMLYIETQDTNNIRQRTSIMFSLVNATSQSIKWKANPEAEIYNRGTWAYFIFQKPGPHRIFAIDSLGTDTTFIDVTVGKYYEQPSYEDDELLITPRILSDSANQLELRTVTKLKYECLNNSLITYQKTQGNTYQFFFEKVEAGHECTAGEKKAENISWIVTPYAETGEGNIEIKFNNRLYKGSFKRKGASYEFDWKYESGVVFTTKKI